MKKIKVLVSTNKTQYLVLLALLIIVEGLTVILNYSNVLPFKKFIGELNPTIAIIFIEFVGVILLSFLLYKDWFAICKNENLKGLLRLFSLAASFALITILVDLNATFPADMNVLFPQSLLFYPAIGFLVEIVFHVLPLSLLLISLTSIFRNISNKKIIWICILIVSLLEPVYQIIPMSSSGHYPLWVIIVVVLNLFLFNLSQLIIFKRHGFISMYLFRLIYYMMWHIIWGFIRLELLF